MKERLEKAIKVLAEKINSDVKADEAMKFMQAALNAAHVRQIISTN